MGARAVSEVVDLHAPLLAVARRWMPRILTQICRDPTSPLYGCADRNWWHYKIRDFPSIILQQAGYACHCATMIPDWKAEQEPLDAIAAASARFWNVRAQKHNAFEEYYPWEQGYPPLAFSTLAAAKLAAAGGVGSLRTEELRPGLTRAARQLRKRFEDKAANQQVAGLAALAWIDHVLPDQADAGAFARQKERTLALQHDEGWYWEYDGPDLGYLAVTIDCLWDLHDATDDEVYLDSIGRALAFMAAFVGAAPSGVGLHNSRNTDYLVPYGILRSAVWGDVTERRNAAAVAEWAFARADQPDHFFASVDDRYICHYIGQSLMRALLIFNGNGPQPAERLPEQTPQLLPGSGHYLADKLIVSCRKGGIVTLAGEHHDVSDFGWLVERGKTQFVTHWWSLDWRFREEGGAVTIEGAFFPHKEKVSTPFKHIVLRCLSFLLGRRLIAILKRVLIFKRGGKAELTLTRTVRRLGDQVEIVDRIGGLTPSDRLARAPRASKRHVASADSFHAQDMRLTHHNALEEQRAQEGDTLVVTTRLNPF
jgi:hypothetical protein